MLNGRDIYECREGHPLIIPCKTPSTRFRITNGFHASKEILVKDKPAIYFYEIECGIDNIQLLTGLILTALFLCIFIFTGIRLFMIAANLPLIIMFFIVFIRKRSFIRVHLVKSAGQLN
ncbi:MAG: hypothetical protein IPI66_15160 [Chitinophagaceae bacterium]|nr:hypothetical protein [Chitinophagaceae bacterium]